jgi:hypothetical protein
MKAAVARRPQTNRVLVKPDGNALIVVLSLRCDQIRPASPAVPVCDVLQTGPRRGATVLPWSEILFLCPVGHRIVVTYADYGFPKAGELFRQYPWGLEYGKAAALLSAVAASFRPEK